MKLSSALIAVGAAIAAGGFALAEEFYATRAGPTGGQMFDKATAVRRGDVVTVDIHMIMNPPRVFDGTPIVWVHAQEQHNCTNHRSRQKQLSYHRADGSRVNFPLSGNWSDWRENPQNSPVKSVEIFLCGGERDPRLLPIASKEVLAERVLRPAGRAATQAAPQTPSRPAPAAGTPENCVTTYTVVQQLYLNSIGPQAQRISIRAPANFTAIGAGPNGFAARAEAAKARLRESSPQDAAARITQAETMARSVLALIQGAGSNAALIAVSPLDQARTCDQRLGQAPVMEPVSTQGMVPGR